MSRSFQRVLAALFAVLGASPALAQEVEPKFESACAGTTACDGVCRNFDWRLHYERLQRLHDLQQGAGYTTTRVGEFRAEDARVPALKELWYVLDAPGAADGAPLYRCTNAATRDVRISASTSEGAPAYNCFDTNGQPVLLATPWLPAANAPLTPLGASGSALLPLRRYVKTGGTDYRTGTAQAPAGYTLNALYDGTSAPARLGYQRFSNLPFRKNVVGPDSQAGYSDAESLDNGYMKVDFNRVWGYAVGRIWQKGTPRQIVSESIGDMVQSVLRFGAGDPDCRIPNPTQSGGAQCVQPNYGVTARWAGSPVVSTGVTGANPGPITRVSVVRPLEFCHNGSNQLGPGGFTPPWPEVTDTEPMAWKGFVERTDSLTCKLGTPIQPRKDVLRSRTRVVLAANNGGGANQYLAGLNTYWLKPRDLGVVRSNTEWDFDVWCEDFDDPALSRRLLGTPRGNTAVNGQDKTCGAAAGAADSVPRHRHAVVVTRRDGTFGYAVARLSLNAGDTTNVVFRCAVLPCNLPDKGVLIVQANHDFPGVNKSAWSETNESFLVMNTKAATLTRLAELKAEANAGGVDCSN